MKKLLIIFMLLFTLSACEPAGEVNMYTVSFDTQGGSVVPAVEVQETFTLVFPQEPTKEGYLFSGWHTSPNTDSPYDTTTTVTMDFTLYATYTSTAEVVDLTKLSYYSFLSESNPEIIITVEGIGTMTLELFPNVAPNTVNNFIKYIQDGDYSGSTFHRVISGFMIQGGIVESSNCAINGDFSSNGFANSVSHTRGAISMARTYVKNSGTSQFFIVHQNSTFLDGEYAAFGGLVSGFTILDSIAIKNTNVADKPIDDIVIEGITVELNGYVVEDVVCVD